MIRLFDHSDLASDSSETGLVWSGPSQGSLISLEEKVVATQYECRDFFIQWAGQLAFQKANLAESLKLEEDFSQWWLGFIAERDLTKPHFFRVFKLLALDQLMKENSWTQVEYVGNDPLLQQIFQKKKSSSITQTIKRFVTLLKGILWPLLFWAKSGRQILKTATNQPTLPAQTPVVFSFFPNFDLQEFALGRYHSNYWKDAQNLMETKFGKLTHLVMAADREPQTMTKFLQATRDLRKSGNLFFALEEFLKFSDCLKTSWQLLTRSGKVNQALQQIRPHAKTPYAQLSFAPFLEDATWASLCGPWGATSLLTWQASQKAAAFMKKPRTLFLPLENQPWQAALVAAWKRFNGGAIIGNVHVILREMDMRMLTPKSEWAAPRFARPMVNRFLVPGFKAKTHMLQNCDLQDADIVEVEAVRHLMKRNSSPIQNQKKRLVLFTTLRESENEQALRWLKQLWQEQKLSQFQEIILRPHVHLGIQHLIEKIQLPFSYQLATTGGVSDWVHEQTTVLSTNSSTAVVEATLAGGRAIIMGSYTELDYSPLPRDKYHLMVRTLKELETALHSPSELKVHEWLHLDPNLVKWAQFLGEVR
ncbi:MAG: hypothetical protein AB7F59_07535 [Bdellovibrionales bacterium]